MKNNSNILFVSLFLGVSVGRAAHPPSPRLYCGIISSTVVKPKAVGP